ncbi:branchpoint-bridging protein-like [Iris pallida]|uniref:Branchpoint-bridging protein-like n=1 Tax=Iris pallida TaxID=29817 RepID=A0AAX6HIM4_IRIPA|nr:branchpoint-bridging protein-like [Iris pallida]
MGKESHAVDSDDCSSDNENADEVEEEEPSEVDPEEEPVEEDPFEEEPVEADPSEEETDEEDPCEEEPDEEDPCEEEPSEEGSCEEEPDEDPYDESNVESVHEQEPSEVQREEEPNRQASCVEVVNEEHSCESSGEDETNEEPFEEDTHEEQYEIEVSEDSEADEEEYEEYEEQCEEEPSEEPSEEVPSEPKEPSGDDRYTRQSNPEKNMSADIVSGQKGSIGSLSINLLETPQNMSNNVMAPQKLDNSMDTGKKRRSRWDVKPCSNGTADGGIDVSKKKKSRWSIDDSQLNNTGVVSDHDIALCHEVVKLHAQLYEITRKLQSREVVDERPDDERSPSPPPIYNNLGIKINSREARLREKLKLQRQTIISELIQKNPNYIPPLDYENPKKSKKKPMCPSPTPNSKFCKKLYIPSKEYPEYNFIGLIIGPRGNTQKRMEKETGARICLRGKGSKLERKGKQKVRKLSDKEELHVLVEADSQGSLDAAVAMVEKLLIPVVDGRHVHKLAQLRELATLNGCLRSKGSINSGKKLCDICGDATHSTSACPLTASDPGANTNEHDVSFLSELRGAFSAFSSPEVPSSCIHSVANIASASSKPKEEIDNTTLYVGCLPHSVDDNKLVKLFSPFGQICESRVVRGEKRGLSSSSYGFVKYFDHIKATMAVTQMNGYKIDGKVLVVQTVGNFLSPDKPKIAARGLFDANQLPQYPGYAAIAHSNPGPMCSPCPPRSVLPESAASFVKNSSNSVYHNHFRGQASASLGPFCQPPPASALLSRDVAPSDELANFPGYLKSLGPPSQLLQASQTTYPSSSQVHFTPKFSYPYMPPP